MHSSVFYLYYVSEFMLSVGTSERGAAREFYLFIYFGVCHPCASNQPTQSFSREFTSLRRIKSQQQLLYVGALFKQHFTQEDVYISPEWRNQKLHLLRIIHILSKPVII